MQDDASPFPLLPAQYTYKYLEMARRTVSHSPQLLAVHCYLYLTVHPGSAN